MNQVCQQSFICEQLLSAQQSLVRSLEDGRLQCNYILYEKCGNNSLHQELWKCSKRSFVVGNFRKFTSIHSSGLGKPTDLGLVASRCLKNCFMMIRSIISKWRPQSFPKGLKQWSAIRANGSDKMVQPCPSYVHILLEASHWKRLHVISKPLGQLVRIFFPTLCRTQKIAALPQHLFVRLQIHQQCPFESCNWLSLRNLNNSC